MKSIGFVSKKRHIHISQSLKKWITNKEQLMNELNKHSRSKSKSNIDRSEYEIMEIQLENWVLQQREKGACIDSSTLKSKAA